MDSLDLVSTVQDISVLGTGPLTNRVVSIETVDDETEHWCRISDISCLYGELD